MQDRSEGSLFCNSPSFKLLKIYQLQMEKESSSVFMPLLWPKFSSKAIHKTNEDPNFSHLEIESETDSISNSSQIHFDISSSNFEVFDQQ